MLRSRHDLRISVEVASDFGSLLLRPVDPAEREILRASLLVSETAARSVGGGFRISAHHFTAFAKRHEGIEIVWEVGAERFLHNRRDLARRHLDVLASLSSIRAGGRSVAAKLLTDISGLESLDDHQVVNVAAMLIPGSPGLCIFDEQGTGKTVVSIFGFDALVTRKEVDFLLIVAPKSMVPEWVRDFRRFKGDLYAVETMVGTNKEKRAALASRPDVVVTNYETAVSMEAELAAHLRARHGRSMLVVDESFMAKNFDAARTRAIRALREECDRAYVLCGTPAPNRPHDLVQQMSIVDFGTAFGEVTLPDDRTEALPIVQRVLDGRGLFVRHRKSDVLPNLPDREYTRIILPLQPQQRRAYEAALSDLILDLRSSDPKEISRRIPSILARRSALLQICASPASIIPGYSETPAKLVALDTILREAIEDQREKVVVWSFFRNSIDAIERRYAQYSPVRYDGSITDAAERGAIVQRFQEDDSTMLFVGNPAAAGAGLTLHRARIAVYESLSAQAAHFLQSLDRIHRRGQTREVKYIFLVCDGSIEVQEYERIAQKDAASRSLLSDSDAIAITRETLLSDALALHELLRKAP